MYEAVYAHPDGDSTVSRFADTLAGLDYEGVVVRSRADSRPDYDPIALAEEHDLDVVDGVTIDAPDPSRASGAVANHRSEHTILVVRGGGETMNRYAVEEPKVDVLARPGSEINHVVVKAAMENDVRLEFDLGRVLRESGGPRVQALQALRKLRELVEKYDAPYVVSASPSNHLELRAPRDLEAVGDAIGFDPEQIAAGLREWRALTERNRERMSADFIAPGLRRGKYEEDG